MDLLIAKSLRWRLTIMVALAVVLPMLVAILVAYQQGTKKLRQEAKDKLLLKATALANNVMRWDHKMVQALRNTSLQPDIISMDPVRQEPVLRKMFSIYTETYLIHTTDLRGHNVARSDLGLAKWYGDRPYLQSIVTGKADLTRTVLIGRSTELPAVAYAAAIKNEQDQIVGAIIMGVDLTEVTKQVETSTFGATGFAFAIDPKGRLIASPSTWGATQLQDRSHYPPAQRLMTNQPGFLNFEDEEGQKWLSYGIPLTNQWGVVAQQQESDVYAQVLSFSAIIIPLIIISLTLVCAITWLIAARLLKPIQDLTLAAEAMANGNLAQTVESDRLDEVGKLAQSFNTMAEQLKGSFLALEVQRNSFARFFPEEFLRFFQKGDVTKVKLGDHISKDMAVMFSDIRSFTALSEKMTPQENFDFVNAYLQNVSPEIRRHRGFVVKFLGDGIMAVFPENADDAIAAGIAKFKRVAAFNLRLIQCHRPTIEIGMGIHLGRMMVGMVGDDHRIQGDAFSDTVNLTARLEGLTKFYGISLLISEQTLQQLSQPTPYQLRFLDQIIVQGRTDPIRIYEVLDAADDLVRSLKLKTLDDFQQGIEDYQLGHIDSARAAFTNVLAINKNDKTAVLYLERLQQFEVQGIPKDWHGIWQFAQK